MSGASPGQRPRLSSHACRLRRGNRRPSRTAVGLPERRSRRRQDDRPAAVVLVTESPDVLHLPLTAAQTAHVRSECGLTVDELIGGSQLLAAQWLAAQAHLAGHTVGKPAHPILIWLDEQQRQLVSLAGVPADVLMVDPDSIVPRFAEAWSLDELTWLIPGEVSVSYREGNKAQEARPIGPNQGVNIVQL